MSTSELIEVIAEKCQNFVTTPGAIINGETRLDALGIDSMQAIVLFHELEEHFQIEISNEVFDSIATVGDVAVQLQRLTLDRATE